MSSLFYMIGFLVNGYVPKGIDTGIEHEFVTSVVVNIGLATAYFLLHSIMARPWFKQLWTKFIPASIERSTYILFSGASFYLLVFHWQPITIPVWTLQNEPGRLIVLSAYLAAWAAMLFATFNIDHFSFFGLRQAWSRFQTKTKSGTNFSAKYLYRFSRHPISLCWFLVLWLTPSMTLGHLILAIVGSLYILIATPIEEKDQIKEIGETYKQYQKEVRRFIPLPKCVS